MTMTDPVADLLTRIRNAHLTKHDRLEVPSSKVKLEVCRLLKEEGFIRNFSLLERRPLDQRPEELRRLALADLEKALEYAPELAAAHLLVAKLQSLPGGDRSKAMAAVDEAIRLFKDDNEQRSTALVLKARLTNGPEAKLAQYDEAILTPGVVGVIDE